MDGKPYSAACERNRDPILEVLRRHFADRSRVLEIGSGTGQHAVYFARQLAHLQWQPSDRAEHLAGIRAWCEDADIDGLRPTIELDVNGSWPAERYDAVYSANTLHIMSWDEVGRMFACLPAVMTGDARLVIYGPFHYDGRPTSDSNAAFDRQLRARAAHMGVRDFEAVDALARAAGLHLREDVPMPANNRCLVWQRQG